MNRGLHPRTKLILACVASGILCGLMTALSCQRAETDCQIAPLQALSSDSVPWTLWFHWVNWAPGALFGLLFAAALLPPGAATVRRAVLFSAISAAIYLVAGLVFSVFMHIAGGDDFSLIIWIWPGGLVAGLLGAFLLALAARRFLVPMRSSGMWLRKFGVPAVVGALTGLLFIFICSYGEQHILLALPLAFTLWQVPVGLALAPPTESRIPVGAPSLRA